MSADETQKDQVFSRPVKGCLTIGIAFFVISLVVSLAWRPAAPIPTDQKKRLVAQEDNGLDAARQTLGGETDAATCRAAIQQINSYLGQAPDSERPPLLSDAQAKELRKSVQLEKGDIDEIEGGSYTALDAKHVEFCLLLRDVAHSLEIHVPGNESLTSDPLARAQAAFDWVVRQVRLRPSGPVTPDLALRRGWGTDVDRALIFLSLLRQLSPPTQPPAMYGTLVIYQAPNKGKRLWACGVLLAGSHDLYLFDPRLGMALPGPGGKGIATLEQIVHRPEVLAQLNVPDAPRYDVTAEQAREAELSLFCPLSSLSPRMRHLQEVLLPPMVQIRLAIDPSAELAALRATTPGSDKKAPPVSVWRAGVDLWRQFLPSEEGGVDRPANFPIAALPGFSLAGDTNEVRLTLKQRFLFELVPWYAMPPFFQDNRRFPYNVGLGQRVREIFGQPFLRAVMESGPRDWLLRGHFRRAATDLVQEREHWQMRAQQLKTIAAQEPQEFVKRVGEWTDRATAAYAAQLRARTPEERAAGAAAVNDIWKQAEDTLILLQGAIAGPRLADITYQLALCKHEEAQRLQARLDLLARRGSVKDVDREKCQAAWEDAMVWWRDFEQMDWRKDMVEYGWWKPETIQGEARQDVIAARRLRARAEEGHGDIDAAIKTDRDLSGPVTDLEKLALLYRARQLSAQKGK